MTTDILIRRNTHFVLWRPQNINPPPQLVIGILKPGNPPEMTDVSVIDLTPSSGFKELWEIDSRTIGLTDGQVYHYWFRVVDSFPFPGRTQQINITDPFATAVDWRMVSPVLPSPYSDEDRDPASVIMFKNNTLVVCDPGGEHPVWSEITALRNLRPNNFLVIYELPTRWSSTTVEGVVEIGVGTFRDVRALVDAGEGGANFEGLELLRWQVPYLLELGINALELLPPSDSFIAREWGYATSNYLAADFDLGYPEANNSPTATTDLAALVESCHKSGIRFIPDVVMAFATRAPNENLNYLDFHVKRGTGDPEESAREDFGGKLMKYNYRVQGYDPITGANAEIVPARQWMKAFLSHWMTFYRVDGIRMDSVANFNNWEFIKEFRDLARGLWRERWLDQNNGVEGAEERFLVIGEELSVPLGLVYEERLDALWNEGFQTSVREALLGGPAMDTKKFTDLVEGMVNCTKTGFRDGSQAINYITSHDVEGFRKERLYNFLDNNGIPLKEKRIKLAFVCLLTAVGIPMILAGEEFADQHDRIIIHPDKQGDPVNFGRREDPWRQDIFRYVSGLVKFRRSAAGLSVNDTRFIHHDFTAGRKVIAWERGKSGTNEIVVVVANFSDWGTENPWTPGAEYKVGNWPQLSVGHKWVEVTQNRVVADGWAGREPLFPWEAKVYSMEPA